LVFLPYARLALRSWTAHKTDSEINTLNFRMFVRGNEAEKRRHSQHGAWRMAHGAWRMAHGAWRMAHGAWRMEPKSSDMLSGKAANMGAFLGSSTLKLPHRVP
jgi:hypothetical protein